MDTNNLLIGAVILLIIFIYISNNSANAIKVKELDIIFLKMSSCPYCVKMENLLADKKMLDHINTIEVNTPEGMNLAKKYGSKGFPFFISKSTGKTTSGYTEDLDRFITSLS